MTHIIVTIFYFLTIFTAAQNAHHPTHEFMINTQSEQGLTGSPFPRIETVSLAGDTLIIPDDTKGKYTLLCFAYVQNAQSLVDTWTIPVLEKYPSDEIHYYEIPMLASGYKYVRGFIDGGMKRGVPTHLHRHVATYYGPLNKYKSQLEMPDSKTVYLFLLDTEGRIIHNDEGVANEDKLRRLYSKIELE